MKTANETLRALYLDYVNNYLTVDKFAEHHEIHPTDARRLLSMGKVYHEEYAASAKHAKAVAFFKEHAGYSYNPKTQTPEQGRLECACALADAELSAAEFNFHWGIDPDVDSSEFSDEEPSWNLWECIMRNEAGDILGALCGIDLGRHGHPETDPYARVVQAEIAEEYFNEVKP